jgi:hypothetical protein
MSSSIRIAIVAALALAAGGAALAQNRIRTETIRPPQAPATPVPVPQLSEADIKAGARARVNPGDAPAQTLDIITDLSRLPPAVAQTRERILAAARSGDLEKLVAVMQSNGRLPVFSFADAREPAALWRSSYPDSDGLEVLAILITILESGYTIADKGTPQEIYVWPYLARMPLKSLTPEQKVQLFRIVTGSDFKEMMEYGAYSFYRLGIGPDGSWYYFVAGD